MSILKMLLFFGNIFGSIIRILGLQNMIILEAEQGMTQNTLAVFHEMLKRGWDKKYRFLLASKSPDLLVPLKSRRVSVIRRPQDGDNLCVYLRFQMKKIRAVMIIDENIQIRKGTSNSIRVYLSHGSPVKNTHEYYNCLSDTDYALCQSEFWKPIESYCLAIPERVFVIKGLPRNDLFFSSKVMMADLFGDKYKKVVVWYPTFRQRDNRNCMQNTESAPIPIIHEEAAAKQINEIAARYGVLIVVKPHPVQDISLVEALNLSNLKVITDDFFIKHGLTSYEFLGKTDALITDYSSVIFDYLLTRKPVALAQEDYEEYEKKVGFAIDMDLLRSCSVQLNVPQDFEEFFSDLVGGNDPLREKREELMHLTNQYIDGNSTLRTVDWLEDLLDTR